MLRVLTLSTLYPDAGRPTFGGFVERQTQALAGLEGVTVEVASGVGLPPWPASLHPHYRARRRPESGIRNGVFVHRLPFRTVPRFPGSAGKALAAAWLPFLRGFGEPFPFDVIDAEFFWPDGVAAMHLSRALGVPFSMKARGSDIHHWGGVPKVRAQMVEAAGEAGGLLAVSAALKASMVELGMPGEKIAVDGVGLGPQPGDAGPGPVLGLLHPVHRGDLPLLHLRAATEELGGALRGRPDALLAGAQRRLVAP